MNPLIFWAGFLTLLLLDLIFFDRLDTPTVKGDLMAWLMGCLFIIGTIALPWKYWFKRSALILVRAAALVGVVMLALTVLAWLSAADVFVVRQCDCPPRVGTFWPLLFIWVAAIGIYSFALWPEWTQFRKGITSWSIKTIAWYSALLVWTTACDAVFVRNITWAVVTQSFLSLGKILGVIALIIDAIAAIIFLVDLPSRRKHKRVRADFVAMDSSVRDGLIRRIDEQCRLGPHQLCYRIVDRQPADSDLAKVGGLPLALHSESWPTDNDGKPGKFLMQIPLRAQRLQPQWHNRILVLYLIDYQPLVRSYDQNTQQLHLLPSPIASEAPRALTETAMPYVPTSDESETEGGFEAEIIFSRVPDLRNELLKFSPHPELLLSMLLNGPSTQRALDATDQILVGGDPILIQNEHDAVCSICNQPMRFLMQSCDVTDSFEFGDAGVVYIYGCDTHPDNCEGFIDCH